MAAAAELEVAEAEVTGADIEVTIAAADTEETAEVVVAAVEVAGITVLVPETEAERLAMAFGGLPVAPGADTLAIGPPGNWYSLPSGAWSKTSTRIPGSVAV